MIDRAKPGTACDRCAPCQRCRNAAEPCKPQRKKSREPAAPTYPEMKPVYLLGEPSPNIRPSPLVTSGSIMNVEADSLGYTLS
ncbi:hypothetical protein BC936DRAFT_137661 [Jimgerdemannia flammicorona]|uniref:Uncharacterized protein n=1 Tax=Jimgerdemannia flammicorona TaxID=994334 RepID=A0A433CWW8_9FUNG|nr:hypothetical protein BC936DRAFT_137661 [Jimgerdemannia flammicorona]